MGQFGASLVFLISVYWPFLLGAAAVGTVTGWLSLSRPDRGKGGA